MKITAKVGYKKGRGEVASCGYYKKNMSKTWTIIMYSAIGVVSAASVFVAGHVVGTKRAGKAKKLPVQESANTQETAQA